MTSELLPLSYRSVPVAFYGQLTPYWPSATLHALNECVAQALPHAEILTDVEALSAWAQQSPAGVVITTLTAEACLAQKQHLSPLGEGLVWLLLAPSLEHPVADWDVDAANVLPMVWPSTANQLALTAVALQKWAYSLSLGQAQAMLDGTTGLLNPGAAMSHLQGAIASAKRYEQSLSCALISVNFWKLYQDSYGRRFTEALMTWLGSRLNTQKRQEDTLARFSDDELLMIMPHTPESGAEKFIARVVEQLQQEPFTFEGQTETLELVAGITGFPDIAQQPLSAPPEELMVRYARHALYYIRHSEVAEHSVARFSTLPLSLPL